MTSIGSSQHLFEAGHWMLEVRTRNVEFIFAAKVCFHWTALAIGSSHEEDEETKRSTDRTGIVSKKEEEI
jgi:hypothetical protein